MTSKIRIKLGPIEVDFEGSEAFLKDELPQLLAAVSDMYSKSNIPQGAEELDVNAPPGEPLKGTTATYAAKLAVKQGSDLIVAAAASLTFSQGKATFSRQDLIDQIKTASGYYKNSYLGNMTPYITSLMSSGKLLESSPGNYSLSAPTQKDLRTRLA